MDSRIALVGRSESCQIMLRDESVSRFHASLLRTSKGVWIVDLQAREGVVINGVRVKWAWLEDGDTVRIGQFTFILRYETVPEQISRRDVPLEAGASPTVSSGAAHSRQGRDVAGGSIQQSFSDPCSSRGIIARLDARRARSRKSCAMGAGHRGTPSAVCHVAAADADDGVFSSRHDSHGANVRGDAPGTSCRDSR